MFRGFGFSSLPVGAIGGGAPAPAPTAPGYLDETVAPYAAYGTQRVIDGYAGNIFTLRRTSDSATQSFACQSGGDYPDYAAIEAWAGSAQVRVNTWFDQSGNGHNLVASSTALEPWLDLDHPIEGKYPIIFDHTQHILEVGSLTLDQIALSTFAVMMPEPRLRETGTLRYTNEAASSAYFGWGGTAGRWPRSNVPNSQAMFGSGQWTPPKLWVAGFANDATRADIYSLNVTGFSDTLEIDAVGSWSTTRTTQAIARLQVGYNTVGNTQNACMWCCSVAVYNSKVSTTNGALIYNSLATAYDTTPNMTFEYVVTVTGDSIVDGFGCDILRTAPQQLREQLTKNNLVYNKGVTADTINSAYSSRVARYGGSTNVHSGIPNVIFVQQGTNDLGGVSPLTTAAGLYAVLDTLVTYLQGQGYLVCVCTILPREETGGWTSTQEAERLDYNDLVRANTTGADYVLDFAANPVMGDSADVLDTTIYDDGIHPTGLGYSYLAGAPSGTYSNDYTYYKALVDILRTTALGGSYVP